tara:strand:- start:6015 stop:6707 length:693 start_codon:yes stop_codon:yes gene_type:complete
MINNIKFGKFITFEGGEGTGKSTQISNLSEYLKGLGIDVIKTREPGGSLESDKIRSILISGATNKWDPISEVLLNFAARREHFIKTILPSLEKGHWVLSDRYVDSTLAYQGYAQGVDKSFINKLYLDVIGDLTPDLTIIFDMPIEESLERASIRNKKNKSLEDRYERMDLDFHRKIRSGFLSIAKDNPERCRIIKANDKIENVSRSILNVIENKFISELELKYNLDDRDV